MINREKIKPEIDLAAIRGKLEHEDRPKYWRSLEQLARTKDFQEMLHREFPAGASEWWDGVSRRNFLKMTGASLALAGLSACTKQPPHEILPYVRQPENLVPGEPLFYATAIQLGGFATGVLAKNREGHPIKIEGNPDHPACRGRSGIWMQASIFDLYDPDRSQAVTHQGEISTWSSFLSDLIDSMGEQAAKKGSGLRFLTETMTSPTLAAQLGDLLRRFPEARWHQYEPLNRDNVREGARQAFGEVVETHYTFDKAKVILSLDSDFLHAHPQRLRYAREFADGRKLRAGSREMNRLYVVESTPTITGSMAEHRLPLRSGEIEGLARRIAHEIDAQIQAPQAALLDAQRKWLAALTNDLRQHRGESIVIAGEWQPSPVHALANLLNQTLGNVGSTVFYAESAEANSGDVGARAVPAPSSVANQLGSLKDLIGDIEAGKVDALFILGGNPVYTSPADFEFAQHVSKVKRSIHLSSHLDETSALCTWHIPQTHYLESWSDARSFDGTVSIIQPLIAPLYNGKSAHELLGAIIQQQPIRNDYEIVREHWRSQNLWPDFEKGWRKALHDGLIAGTETKKKVVRVKTDAFFRDPGRAEPTGDSLEATFRPDPSIWDGRFANNGWLQECPKPITKLTWDNALLVSPALAQKHGLNSDDVIELSFRGRTVRGPVRITPGQAENSITLPLGFGRQRAGRIGNGVGFNAYAVRTSDAFWSVTGATLRKTDARHHLVATQTHHHIESPERQVYRAVTLREVQSQNDIVKKSVEAPENNHTLYDPNEYPYAGYKWGMSIDLTTCIGCNACLVACEVENNIPVVGKDQVDRNREMHWIRVDTYYRGSLDNPEFNHMPVPCMHCEHAPCELVCPVEATVHDHEGLNLQVYNRCVGTRFCSNNCPYKVRRFNFYQYTDYHTPSIKPMYNPDVTVRWRGVMEKCTYCIQRISRARITAEKENRRIRDGEVVTACQQACPADAIVFGDLNDPRSKVAGLKQEPLDYPMLGQLNTRPRTTYLAKVTNPSAEMEVVPSHV
jgi:molybdopterin-containing oxidoreductase family iron-sulfur binding subunit